MCLSFSCRDLRQSPATFPSWVILQAMRVLRARRALDLRATRRRAGRARVRGPRRARSGARATPAGGWRASAHADPSAVAAIRAAFPALAAGEAAEAARESEVFTPFDGWFPRPARGSIRVVRARVVSPTSLEELAKCPFRHFLQRGLGLDAVEDAEPDPDVWLDPLTRGSLLHGLYATFLRELRDRKEKPDPGATARGSAQLGEEVLAAPRRSMPPPSTDVFDAGAERVPDRPGPVPQVRGARSRTASGWASRSPSARAAPRASRSPVPSPSRSTSAPGSASSSAAGSTASTACPTAATRRWTTRPEAPSCPAVLDATFAGGRQLQHALYALVAAELLRAKDPSARVAGSYYFPTVAGGGERVVRPAAARPRVARRAAATCSTSSRRAPSSTRRRRTTAASATSAGRAARRAAERAARKIADPANAALAAYREARASMSDAAPGPRPGRPRPDRERLDVNLLVEAGAGSGKTECLARRMARRHRRRAATRWRRWRPSPSRARPRPSCAAASSSTLERRSRASTDPARRERLAAALRPARAALRRHHPRLLRPPAARAAGRGGRGPRLHRARRVEDLRAAPDGLARLSRSRASARLAGAAGAARGRRDAPRSRRRLRHRVQLPEVDVPAGRRRDPRRRARAPRARDVLGGSSSKIAPGADPARRHVQDATPGPRLRRRLASGDLDEPRGRWPTAPQAGTSTRACARWLARDDGQRRDAKARWTRSLRPSSRRRCALPRGVAPATCTAWRSPCFSTRATQVAEARTAGRHAQLRGPPPARGASCCASGRTCARRSRRKYRWLFVDEFQDTDPIQAEVILLARRAAARRASATGRGCPSAPGALFVVGDPKQSIYRFRRADIDTYCRVRERIRGDGRRDRRRSPPSFRSVPALCDWANTVFRRLFPAEPTPQQPAFHRLEPVRDARRPRRSAVSARITIPDSISGADDVARPTPRSSPDSSAPRSTRAGASRGDFLILTRVRRAPAPLRARPRGASACPSR